MMTAFLILLGVYLLSVVACYIMALLVAMHDKVDMTHMSVNCLIPVANTAFTLYFIVSFIIVYLELILGKFKIPKLFWKLTNKLDGRRR